MAKISVKIGNLELFAETTSENPKTVEAILERLPIEGETERWGEEIYFLLPFDLFKEVGRDECEPGEIAFWSDGPAIAIFFGKTPMSTSDKPKAFSACNFFARLSKPLDKKALNAVRTGEKIVLSKA